MIDFFYCGALDLLILGIFTYRGTSYGRMSAALAMIGLTWLGVGAPWWLAGAAWIVAIGLFALHARLGEG